MKIPVLLATLISFSAGAGNINPLIGHWVVDYEKTLASTIENSKAYNCFKEKLCGSTDLIFSENELLSISYTQDGKELVRHSEPYKIVSYQSNEIEIYYPLKEKSFTYKLEQGFFYYSSVEHGFTEYFVMQK